MRPPLCIVSAFPAYIADLITSLGPVTCENLMGGMLYVPVMEYDAVRAVRPTDYDASAVGIFRSGRAASIPLGDINVFDSTSSGWWTVYPVHHSVQDRPSISNSEGERVTVFSPFAYDSIPHHQKLAVAFAEKPLVHLGVGLRNASAWYWAHELGLSPGAGAGGGLPSPGTFPREVKEDPVFWKSCSAYHAEVEAQEVEIQSYLSSDNEGEDCSDKKDRLSVTGPCATYSSRASFSKLREGYSVPDCV